jgi:hypothetical protein
MVVSKKIVLRSHVTTRYEGSEGCHDKTLKDGVAVLRLLNNKQHSAKAV